MANTATLSAPASTNSPSKTSSKDSANVMKRYVLASTIPQTGEKRTILTPHSLQGELMSLMTAPTPGISAFPHDGDMLHWDATLLGPEATPYQNLTLKLSFHYPARYPFVAPEVRFRTPIYHPNVDFKGRICLDILKDKWSAVLNTTTVLLSLQSLLGEPNK